ncbi:MAG: hypothetical protein QNJ12_23115 [Ilumatobacter sp.]|uniref:hypothetical protein n=1 Tax=Ilumatobacter sp. TaxID=1967498 RepID=UPI002609FA5C|nr:hypothetical protein [Ilumatobacter sp.]MDJ0771696.1 hypothetical protein [Ilumatobacter sp.]
MSGGSAYEDIAAAVESIGMIARGGFSPAPDDGVPPLADGRPTRTVIVIGNVGGAMWPHFRRGESPGADPLDRWTREQLRPVAARFDATYVHPSDEPYQPFQRWAQRAADVWQSPIGLLVHRRFGLWHAYRGAFLLAEPVDGVPTPAGGESPCVDCDGQPCLSTCPVGAFTDAGYDTVACADHVRSDRQPDCLAEGCAARRACPIGGDGRYGPDQMAFHMRAFVGMPS